MCLLSEMYKIKLIRKLLRCIPKILCMDQMKDGGGGDERPVLVKKQKTFVAFVIILVGVLVLYQVCDDSSLHFKRLKNIHNVTRNYLDLFALQGPVNILPIPEANNTMMKKSSHETSCKRSEKNIVFLKTHKTGSSTITNILNRYADMHGLVMLLPQNALNRFHYPNIFRESYIEKSYLKIDGGKLRKANMLSNHARLNKLEMMKVMHAGTKFITILRDPVTQFESSFYYFQFYKGIVESKDPLSEFLSAPEKYFKLMAKRHGQSIGLLRNGMLFDLGLNTLDANHSNLHANETIRKVRQQFDVVLLMEYIDESLVLLMRKFCWTYGDILYLKQNARSVKRPRLSAENQTRIKQWNEHDSKLYKTFNETFWKKIQKQGKAFWDDLKEFRDRRKALNVRCGIGIYKQKVGSDMMVDTFKISVKDKSDIAFCEKVTLSEVNYIQYFRKQYTRKTSRRIIKR